MKSPYVSELQPNQIVTAAFLVQHKDIRQKRTGEPYLTLMLADRTGEVEAKMWDNAAEVMDTFERDDYVRIRGLLQIHHNRPQITLHKVQRLSQSEVDPADYYPCSARDSAEMFADLQGTIASIGNRHLRLLLERIFEDPEIAAKYRRAPAAKTIHHAYLGGLLEHVLSVCSLAKAVAPHYKEVDLDLLLAGVILHDVGKVHELTYEGSFAYSSDGQLLGHIMIGLRLVAEKLAGIQDFPPRLRTLLEHMILSHHGELEYGSPKLPLFPEALLLHHLDNLDSKMDAMRQAVERDRQVEGMWTSYSSSLDRPVLRKSRYLDENPAAESIPVAPAAPVALSRQEPPPPPRPVAPVTKPDFPQRQPASSVFADKLKQAIAVEPEAGRKG